MSTAEQWSPAFGRKTLKGIFWQLLRVKQDTKMSFDIDSLVIVGSKFCRGQGLFMYLILSIGRDVNPKVAR
jgi:hypothetical protein